MRDDQVRKILVGEIEYLTDIGDAYEKRGTPFGWERAKHYDAKIMQTRRLAMLLGVNLRGVVYEQNMEVLRSSSDVLGQGGQG